jgi:hypothetical protein
VIAPCCSRVEEVEVGERRGRKKMLDPEPEI